MSWQKDREMSPAQLRKVIKQLGISQAATGRLLGIGDRQIRRYLTGEATVPIASAMLLRSMVYHGDVPQVPSSAAAAEERAR